MIVKRAYKYRLYPNRKQKEMLEQHFGCSRYVYNYYLRKRIDCYMLHKKSLTYQDNANDLVFLKKELPWLSDVNSQSLQATLKDLENAYANFFSKKAKFPRFKKKHSAQSFRVPQHFKVNAQSISIPKLGRIRAKIHRPVGDKCYNVTISKSPSGKYYASVICDSYIPDPDFTGNTIGIDLGIKSYLVNDSGYSVDNPKYLQKYMLALQKLQQLLSKKVKGSNNYNKLRLKTARLYEKISNQRSDFLHKLSLQLVRENQAIGCETLSVKKMLMESNHTLARHIQDSAWYQFLTFLEYKGEWYGCHILKVDKYFPSSKRCSECGFINEDLRLEHREWKCSKCNTSHTRDINAARNIKSFAVGTTV